MAGRPPKPTELQVLTGAFRKNPKRLKARAGEPQPPKLPVGGPPARWMIFHPDIGYQDCEKLRMIWADCLKMWPWVTFSDRDSLQDYCRFKLKMDESRKLSGAELSAMIRIRSELGGTGSGRVRLGVKAPGGFDAAAPVKVADPRGAFLARKFG